MFCSSWLESESKSPLLKCTHIPPTSSKQQHIHWQGAGARVQAGYILNKTLRGKEGLFQYFSPVPREKWL